MMDTPDTSGSPPEKKTRKKRDKKERLKPPAKNGPTSCSPELFATIPEVYRRNLGNVKKTCAELDINEATFTTWRCRYPDFMKLLTEIARDMLAPAMNNVGNGLTSENPIERQWATDTVIKHQGHHIGMGPNATHLGPNAPGNQAPQFNINFIPAVKPNVSRPAETSEDTETESA